MRSSLLLFPPRQRDRPLRSRDLSILTRRAPVLPPENHTEDKHHEIDPSYHQPLTERDIGSSPPPLPVPADVQKQLRIVRDDAVEFPSQTPTHHLGLIDRPHVQRTALGFGVADEAGPEDGQHEGLLEHVEGDARDGEELARVGDREANVRDGVGGQVVRAEGQVLDGPAAEDDALVPGFGGGGGYGTDGFGDEAHDGFGVVVELL